MKNFNLVFFIGVLGPLFFGCVSRPHPRDWKYREVPSHLDEGPKQEYFIIMGGPLAYGKNVSAQDSLANRLNQLSNYYKVYNRAQNEATMEDILLSLENRYFLRSVKEITGVVALLLEKDLGKIDLQKVQEMKSKLSSRIRFVLLCQNPEEWKVVACFQLKFSKGVVDLQAAQELLKRF